MKTVISLFFLVSICSSVCAQLNKRHFIDKAVLKLEAASLIVQVDTGHLHMPNGTVSGISYDTAYFNSNHELVKFTRNQKYKTSKGNDGARREAYYYIGTKFNKVIFEYYYPDTTRSDIYYIKDKKLIKPVDDFQATEVRFVVYLLDSWKRLVQFGKKTKYHY